MKLWLDVHGLHARPLIQYVISPWLVNIWTCYGLLHSLIYSVPFPGLSLFLNSNWNASLTTVVFLKLPLTNHQIERQEERVLSSLLLCVVCLYFMHLSMSSRGRGGGKGGRRGIGWAFDIFQKVLSNSLPRGKNVKSNILKFPTPGNDLWSQARTKITKSLLPGQQDNSNSLPPGPSDRSNPRPMPRFAPPPAWHW